MIRPGDRVLTLDLARRTGWCCGPLGARPAFGAVQLEGRTHGAVFAAASNWLADARRIHQPQHIVFEAPLVRGEHAGVSAGRLALGLVAMVELFAHDEGLTVLEEHVGRTRKAVMGRGGFAKGTAKAEVAKWLAGQGYHPQDDNAADALLLWLHAEQVAGVRQPAPGGIFDGRAA
jgi:Holliday junction resolvasome RuvABC endonuclease subunit